MIESPVEKLIRFNLSNTRLPTSLATGHVLPDRVLHPNVNLNALLGKNYERIEAMISFGMLHKKPKDENNGNPCGRMQVNCTHIIPTSKLLSIDCFHKAILGIAVQLLFIF